MIRLCGVADVAPGEILGVRVDAVEPLAVYNVAGRFYVTSDRCTHAVAYLSDGFLDGTTVECPLHGGCFDVTSGAATQAPCRTPLRTYEVVVDGDAVHIRGDG
jgi:ethylbenzene dioxygenase ferredoxin subunit